MPRVTKAKTAHRRHKKVLRAAKGYWGARSRWFKAAKETVMRAERYAYRDRRTRKRKFRQLWIARISAAARSQGLTYSRFAEGLRKAGVEVNRKMLADLAITDSQAFAQLAKLAKEQSTQ